MCVFVCVEREREREKERDIEIWEEIEERRFRGRKKRGD